MEQGNSIILRICLMVKMSPPLPMHSPCVRWGTPGTMVRLPRRPVWSTGSVASPQRAAWRWKPLLTTGDLKTPMPLTVPPCGVQRQVTCFPFFFLLQRFVLCLVLALLPSPAFKKKFLQKESIALNEDLKSLYLNKLLFR